MEWVAGRDRLPESEGLYLVHIADVPGRFRGACPPPLPSMPALLTAFWVAQGSWIGWSLAPGWAECVTHWMPIPPPPPLAGGSRSSHDPLP